MSDILYKGCVIPSRLPFIEAATRYIIDCLELDIIDTGEHPCCIEPVGLRSMNNEAWLRISQIICGLSCGNKIVTLCDGCNLSLSESVNEFNSGPDIISMMEVIHEKLDFLKDKVSVPVDMKLAVFAGCHAEKALGMRGKNAQSMLKDLLSAIGAHPLIPENGLCCGGGVASVDDRLSKEILGESVNSFRSTGAVGVVTVCPFCFMQFDMVARYRTYNIFELVAKSLGWGVDTEKYHRGKNQ